MSQEPTDDTKPLDPDAPESEQAQGANEQQGTQQGTDQAEKEAHGSDETYSETDAPEETIESLKATLATSELKVKDEALRAQSEIQNILRRTERDVANAHKFGQEKLIKDLLAVVDSLERGIQTVDEQQSGSDSEIDPAVKAIRDGSELTLKMFIDTLARFQVKQIDPKGEPFDPQFHEAITMIQSPDAEPNSVIDVVQKGFTLNDRLVRPAMVVVSKA
jgi:molecular chaperone GrpE